MKISHMIISRHLIVSCRTPLLLIFLLFNGVVNLLITFPAHNSIVNPVWVDIMMLNTKSCLDVTKNEEKRKKFHSVSRCFTKLIIIITYCERSLWVRQIRVCVHVTLGVNIVSIFPFSIISVIYTLIRLKLTLHARRNPFFFRLPLIRPLIKSVYLSSNPISALHLLTYNFKLPAYSLYLPPGLVSVV